MAASRAAGLLVWRRRRQVVEVLLAHPGGPLFAGKDAGYWTVPKGEPDPGEPLLDAAIREFAEEIGVPAPHGPMVALGDARQKSGKVNTVWAVEGDIDVDKVVSNEFAMQWPPHSGRTQSFPEIDRAEWFDLDGPAPQRIREAQVVFLDRLRALLAEEHAGHAHDPTCEAAHSAPEPVDVDPVPGRVLVAVYASPVATALLRMAVECGFRPVLVEPDPARAVPGALPVATVRVHGVPELDPDLLATADVVVCDHHRDDLGVPLRDALAGGARWVGIMGSPRHEGPHLRALETLGVRTAAIAQVHRPIGLDIGSRTPAEIAVSTLAGLLADRNGRPGGNYDL